MIKSLKLLVCLLLFVGCGNSQSNEKEKFSYERTKKDKKENVVVNHDNHDIKASVMVDLVNKGVGPIKEISFDNEINPQLVSSGEEIFSKMCSDCHKVGKKFIGPKPNKIFDRRTPEWVMNMILNPEEMVNNDPIAKKLLVEFNGAPMANQNLTEDEARAVVEYFRTLN